MVNKNEKLEGCKYIHIKKEDGEVIASVNLEKGNEDVLIKDGYLAVFGYKDEPVFEYKDGKFFLVD